MLVAEFLRAIGPAGTKKEAERNVVQAIDRTAERLGNTRSVCRKYYIHPALIEAYLEGSVLPPQPDAPGTRRQEGQPSTLRRHEEEVLAFLKERLSAVGPRLSATAPASAESREPTAESRPSTSPADSSP
jgi:DNA topoisomerase I